MLYFSLSKTVPEKYSLSNFHRFYFLIVIVSEIVNAKVLVLQDESNSMEIYLKCYGKY
jgi:hypothetical protein